MRPMAVRLAHAILVGLAVVPWLLGVAGFAIAAGLVMAADRVWPGATHGNCWSFAGPRWIRYGGYLLIRWSDSTPVLHVAIVHRLRDVTLEQFVPVNRRRGWRGVLDSLYFRGRVTRTETPHPSAWGDL